MRNNNVEYKWAKLLAAARYNSKDGNVVLTPENQQELLDDIAALKNEFKPLDITFEPWDYHCEAGCCSDYGTKLILNGEECENEYAGEDVERALEFVLKKLNYKVNINY